MFDRNYNFTFRLQSCPEPETDFREQQCIQYNNQTFRGKQYQWEAYIKGKKRLLYIERSIFD